MDNISAHKAKSFRAFVLAAVTTMKIIPFLLIPSVALLVSACAPAGPTYVSGPGYYGPGGVWVAGGGGYYHDHDDRQYNRSVTNVNDVNVNRTVENDRTVNRTNINRTNFAKKNVQVASRSQAHKKSDDRDHQ